MIWEFACISLRGNRDTVLKYMNSSITINQDLGFSWFSVSKMVIFISLCTVFQFHQETYKTGPLYLSVFFACLTICPRWACALWFLYFKAGLNPNCNFFNKFFHSQKFSIFFLLLHHKPSSEYLETSENREICLDTK